MMFIKLCQEKMIQLQGNFFFLFAKSFLNNIFQFRNVLDIEASKWITSN